MARIKIKDLPRDRKISKEEMKKVIGGFNPQPEPPAKIYYFNPNPLNPLITKGIIIQD